MQRNWTKVGRIGRAAVLVGGGGLMAILVGRGAQGAPPRAEEMRQAASRGPDARVTDEGLRAPDPADWPSWRRDRGTTGFSPLDQITRDNVRHLRLAWAWGMEPGPLQPEPLVYRGVMYLPHPNNVVQALDARTGRLLWEYRRTLPKGVAGVSRNLALYEDKVFVATLDAHLVALDARTGRVAWDVEVADHRQGYRYTAGPLAGDGRVFAGMTCGGTGVARCFVSAHDAATGKTLWRRESVAGPDDPDSHNATWGGVPYAKRNKASLWMTGSYDPEHQLVYWTTGSAYPYTELAKGSGTGALLYTQSILALKADTGAIAWFFQMVPRDNFDLDHADNPILADVPIRGRLRPVVFTVGKPSVLWALDRVTGRYLWHRLLVPYQNIYSRIDPETGAIAINEAIIPTRTGTTALVCPGMRGGKIFQAKAYNPRSDTLYTAVSLACSDFDILPLDKSPSGVNWDRMAPMPGSNGHVGRLIAVSATSGEVRWTYDQRVALGSILTTAGGLVFAGDWERYFRAFDADSGRILWEIPLHGPVEGYPISYAVDGRQYVAVAAGGGSVGQRHLAQLYPEIQTPTSANVLMVFALPDEVVSSRPTRARPPDAPSR
jgi:alcohol dehydrogenase (cytochrome c)